MLPTDILMTEHRLIEQVLNCLEKIVQQAEADFEPLPFDVASARAFGRVAAPWPRRRRGGVDRKLRRSGSSSTFPASRRLFSSAATERRSGRRGSSGTFRRTSSFSG